MPAPQGLAVPQQRERGSRRPVLSGAGRAGVSVCLAVQTKTTLGFATRGKPGDRIIELARAGDLLCDGALKKLRGALIGD
jgi:hypothetical protein